MARVLVRDKASGINVMYASDPYWGEKAASFLYRLGFQAPALIVRMALSLRRCMRIPAGRWCIRSRDRRCSLLREKPGMAMCRCAAKRRFPRKVDVEIPYEESDVVWIPEQWPQPAAAEPAA